MLHHGCLTYADCDNLDYVCEEGGYCDEVYLVLEKRKPIEIHGQSVPARKVRALADRFGVFTSPDSCGEGE
jgi:hypothetical protein